MVPHRFIICYHSSMDEKALKNAVAHVKQTYRNARVILFGSTAKGTDSPDSDLDLCIVIENPEERLRDISRQIRKEIYPMLRKPLDILVYDKSTFEDRSALNLTMEAEIVEQGKEL